MLQCRFNKTQVESKASSKILRGKPTRCRVAPSRPAFGVGGGPARENCLRSACPRHPLSGSLICLIWTSLGKSVTERVQVTSLGMAQNLNHRMSATVKTKSLCFRMCRPLIFFDYGRAFFGNCEGLLSDNHICFLDCRCALSGNRSIASSGTCGIHERSVYRFCFF